jgi:hypothetical protein
MASIRSIFGSCLPRGFNFQEATQRWLLDIFGQQCLVDRLGASHRSMGLNRFASVPCWNERAWSFEDPRLTMHSSVVK